MVGQAAETWHSRARARARSERQGAEERCGQHRPHRQDEDRHARGRSRFLPGHQRRPADRPRAARLPVGLARLGQDLDVSVRSMHADPLPIPDQPGGMLHPTTAGKPYSRAITAP